MTSSWIQKSGKMELFCLRYGLFGVTRPLIFKLLCFFWLILYTFHVKFLRSDIVRFYATFIADVRCVNCCLTLFGLHLALHKVHEELTKERYIQCKQKEDKYVWVQYVRPHQESHLFLDTSTAQDWRCPRLVHSTAYNFWDLCLYLHKQGALELVYVGSELLLISTKLG